MDTLHTGPYCPLRPNNVRLLRLNVDTSSLEAGSLEVVALGEAPSYYALSHCWGTQLQCTEVHIDGQKFFTSSSLAAGIRRLQELATSLDPPAQYVWIDSICINQTDLFERSSQVEQMGKIYSKSIKTIIWLGPHSNSSSSAWGLVDQIYNTFSTQNPAATTMADIPVKMYSESSHMASKLPEWNIESWTHLHQLLDLGWFSRIWVVQEVVLSSGDPIIIHGDYCYPWNRLGWAATWLRRNGYVRLPQMSEIVLNVDTMSNIRRSRNKWPLNALMAITQTKFHAKDQRDKVFGLLGIATESQDPLNLPHALRPNYNVDVTEVYCRVARLLLTQSRSTAMLTRAQGINDILTKRQREYDLNLPSWTPDWSDFRGYDREVRTIFSWIHYSDPSKPIFLGFPKHYNASSGIEAKFYPVTNSAALRLSGLKVDKVVYTIPFNTVNISKKRDFAQVFSTRMKLVLEETMSILKGQDIIDWASCFVKATSAEQYHLGGRSWEQGQKDGFAYLYDVLTQNKALLSLSAQAGVDKPMVRLRAVSDGGDREQYMTLARNYCFNRSFFITSAGKMGIGPSDTRVGDIISVILGGGVPYVIRKQASQWLFVGESYVQGLMDGEAIRACEQGTIQEEILGFI
ncbi:HET domain-containing protein [Hypoxylon rubiginosum]|uniref:HET domain-containing protein n=1 Tax=Hypoxylon rubiginosum TaxID=110542 RepID=A0ACC0CJE3_9PEZI|nr:HET domain-containing protein [Hypoxylon rubiginosum]